MGLDRIHLRKVLKLFMMKENLRSTAIRADARDVMKKLEEGSSPGGDFPIPFWRSAKNHAAGKSDLHESTAHQIDQNWRRKNLYPRFRDGFLKWWNEKRRWVNEEIAELPQTIKSSVGFAEIDGLVKVENLLSLRLGDDKFRYIYAYFSDKPALTSESARLGLWLMGKALPQHSIEDMRILDVLRGETFSTDKYPLRGDEEESFTLQYRRILREWRTHFR